MTKKALITSITGQESVPRYTEEEKHLLRQKIRHFEQEGWSDIDEEIRSLISDLNESGYTTTGCCAGHAGFGFITFLAQDLTPQTKKAIENIMRRHGIYHVTWRRRMPEPDPLWGRRVQVDESAYAIFSSLSPKKRT